MPPVPSQPRPFREPVAQAPSTDNLNSQPTKPTSGGNKKPDPEIKPAVNRHPVVT